jgi:ArsR family transcriptional regulator, arsenate/arsenite/antimonite-responsive transcriptional repressor
MVRVLDDRNAVASLTALAQEHRLKIFRLLVRLGPSGLPAGEIANEIGISSTSTSFHLKELERTGLLRSTRDGRFIRYAVSVDKMRQLLEFLTEDCCQGHPEICGGVVSGSRGLCVSGGEKQ